MTTRRRIAVAAVLGSLAAGLLSAASPAAHTPARAAMSGATPSYVTSAVAADAYAASDQPRVAHNTYYVAMDANPARRAYFRFVVTVPAGFQVARAVFACVADHSNASGMKLWRATNNWTEQTLTWARAPVVNFAAPPVGSTGAVTGGGYALADVTPAITGSGTYTLVGRTASSSQWACLSRQHPSHHPARLGVLITPGITTVRVTADAYAAANQPRVAHNTGLLWMDAGPRQLAYFKFAVTVPAGHHVTKAVLRCWASRSSAAGMRVWPTTSRWWESTLSWANAPMPNFARPPVGTSGPVAAGTYLSVDVTAAITGSGTYTLVGRTLSASGWSCLSKEHSNVRPALVQLTTAAPAMPPAVVDAIGDGGAAPGNWNAAMSAAIRADNPSVLLWAGDVRNTGTPAEWQLYDNHYGALKAVTLPTPGNHDWATAATGYDVEFGTGAPYADTLTYCNGITLPNGWQLFSINTYTSTLCLPVLSAFLSSPGTRKIVLTHAPRWSGGGHGSPISQAPIWDAMKGHAFALVAGHDHDAQVIERDGLVQVISGCAGAAYGGVTPIEGQVYYTTDAADCTYLRLTLGTTTATIQAVHPDGSIDFAKTYSVAI